MAKRYKFLVVNTGTLTVIRFGDTPITYPTEVSFYEAVNALGRNGYFMVSTTEDNEIYMQKEISGNEDKDDD